MPQIAGRSSIVQMDYGTQISAKELALELYAISSPKNDVFKRNSFDPFKIEGMILSSSDKNLKQPDHAVFFPIGYSGLGNASASYFKPSDASASFTEGGEKNGMLSPLQTSFGEYTGAIKSSPSSVGGGPRGAFSKFPNFNVNNYEV